MSGPVVGLVADEVQHTYWVFTERALYELVIADEGRHIWSLYLEKRLFELAYQHCKVFISVIFCINIQFTH